MFDPPAPGLPPVLQPGSKPGADARHEGSGLQYPGVCSAPPRPRAKEEEQGGPEDRSQGPADEAQDEVQGTGEFTGYRENILPGTPA